ncbi:hypothetical protein CPT_Mydo_198 [Proteus phage Mydo]|uniref:Uncharacterized protein n=1 Tax=Proteus phage Mydo TaxID=2483610 RepID=A0A3G8F182_9CAUD|nr:hypothetical protein HWB97_gp257 [Proteus phage Mydo]AZF87768.1 hypothetical protein CPT_Mydo_198 [Proteus phage Mydo]
MVRFHHPAPQNIYGWAFSIWNRSRKGCKPKRQTLHRVG